MGELHTVYENQPISIRFPKIVCVWAHFALGSQEVYGSHTLLMPNVALVSHDHPEGIHIV